jgi:hypothetical protein
VEYILVSFVIMTQVIGMILVLLSVGILIYWLATGRRSKPLLKFVCVFIAAIGFLLILKDKLAEVTIKDWLSIKTSVAEATADAKTIADIKQQVVNQRATVDLVATEAQTAKNLSEEASNKVAVAERKLKDLNDSIQKANDSLKKLDAATEFSLLVSKAQNDDRAAFIQLGNIGTSSSSPFAQSAKSIADTIIQEVQTGTIVDYSTVTINWDLYGINPDTDSLQQLEQAYSAHSNSMWVRFNVVKQIFENSRFSELERYDFLAKVMQSDNSLKVVQLAVNLMTPKSNIRLNFIWTDSYLQWWAKNRSNFTNAPTASH